MLNLILTSKLGHDWTSKLWTLYRCPDLVMDQRTHYKRVYLTSSVCGLCGMVCCIAEPHKQNSFTETGSVEGTVAGMYKLNETGAFLRV